MMKNIFLSILLILVFTSCEDFLNVPRETLDITTEEVWGKYLNAKTFTDNLYPELIAFSNQHAVGYGTGAFKRAGFPNIASDQMRIYGKIDWELFYFNEPTFSGDFCNMGSTYVSNRGNDFKSYWNVVWKPVSRANIILENIKYINDAPTDKDVKYLRGQALFARAFAYSYMLDLWGGMPYITKTQNFDSDLNLSRLSYHETVLKIVEDLDSAALYLPPVWGSGDNKDVNRFTSVAAKALKSRVLLYDASPLSNSTNDMQRWVLAAEASWDALDYALQNSYSLLPFTKYPNLFHKDLSNSEFLYVQNEVNKIRVNDARFARQYFPPSVTNDLIGGAGVYVTQDMVDRFEVVQKTGNLITKALTQNDALTEGFYNPQDPYKNLDPRFYFDIIYHGKNWHPIPDGAKVNSIKIGSTNRGFFDMTGPDTYQNFEDYRNQTSYFIGKFWDGASFWNNFNSGGTAKPCPIIRLAELYLNYAEACNEAYESGNAKVSNATMTALDAVNIVRTRAGMPAIDSRYTADYQVLRERILNERFVELCFEANHPFVDNRRWKLIEKNEYRDTYKMVITKTSEPGYPTGYKFEKQFFEKRSYEPKMYFFPIPQYDINKYSNFKQNQGY